MAKSNTQSSGGIVVPLILMTIVGMASGGAFGWTMTNASGQLAAKKDEKTDTGNYAKKNRKGEKSKNGGKGAGKKGKKTGAGEKSASVERVIELPAVVSNLAGDKRRWIRLEAAIITKPKSGPIPEEVRARLTQDLAGALRQTSLKDIEGAQGLVDLRADLNELVRIRTRGLADEVVIRGLIVE